MGKLLVRRFEAVDFLAYRVDLGQQLQACSAKARSCSGVIWSRLGEEVMPLIVPEQAISGDKPMG